MCGGYVKLFSWGPYCTGCAVSISYPEQNKSVSTHNQAETYKNSVIHQKQPGDKEVGLHTLCVLALHEGEWPASWSSSFTAEETVPIPIRWVVLKTYRVCGPLSNTHSQGALCNKMYTHGPLNPPHLNYLHINLKQTQKKLLYIKFFNACITFIKCLIPITKYF
jgi:hypothetical protein